MSAIDRNPISTNLASALQFIFILKRAPSITYHCTGVELPHATITPATINSPSLEVAFPGDHIIYSPIKISFKVDENFQNYQEILNWMNGISDPNNDGQVYSQLERTGTYSPFTIYSDMTVIQLDSLNNPILEWNFERCFPIGLAGPKFQSNIEDVVFLESSAVMKYTKFTMKRLVLPSKNT